ncbi:transcriptional regulator GcvA [Roseovarius faecimaris]|uniref:Transcriptional regulator GcvA n=1 Tax=Roseovarius faecimaris TaxID=2494550 RepID=A0A6I6IWW1_9RHOB|nr:transcriptional regulator GcvA [Roseovarius faecimaris]QGX99956.1 transcriptional regulator GcvA [Roseovarius faecimaris]
MPDRLPPLTALRAFDAAARHMSFQAAAAELNVTPAALSFQIKSLEEHFGGPLFRRLNRAVELTEAGRALAPGCARGFRELSTAWQTARRISETNTLTVTAGPALTAKWLAPRLYEFARVHPEIDLRFSASLQIVDLENAGVDVAIRFSANVDERYFSIPVRKEWMTPVMTPALAERYTTPESLTDAPLIFDDSLASLQNPPGWPNWFRAMGMDFEPTHGPRFSNADHAIDAAAAGMGIVLGRRAIILQDLLEGRLVAPFKTAVEIDAQFNFACLKGTETRPNVAAFRDWFFSEIEKTAYVSDDFEIIPSSGIRPA